MLKSDETLEEEVEFYKSSCLERIGFCSFCSIIENLMHVGGKQLS